MNLFRSTKFSPLTRKRMRNFMGIRRARVSLVLLGALFALSLAAELLCNSRPLYLRVNGQSFFPFVQNLTQRDLLGGDAEATRVNFHVFTASPAFTANPRNHVIWAPVPYLPGDVIDAATLRRYRTVKVSVVPEVRVGRINLLPDGTVIRPESIAPFFPGVVQVTGVTLSAHWALPDELSAAISQRFDGGDAPEQTFVVRHTTATGATARVTLPQTSSFNVKTPEDPNSQPASVRLMFRQTEAPALPIQLAFRQAFQKETRHGMPHTTLAVQYSPSNNVVAVTQREWRQVPAAHRAEILKLVTEAFKGTAPSATIAWQGRHAAVACALNEIAWPYPPVKGHWMGIDAAGRDVLARVLYGMRIAMIFGLLLAFWAMFFGMIIGAVQGYFGGWIDIAGQRLTEIWSALPFLYVMIFIGAALGRSFLILLVCYSLFNWIGISYYMRAEFLRLRSRTFVEAARCQGLSSARIIFSHILPNALTPLITLFPFSLIGAIGALAALDFLGFGLPPLTPSWGELLQQAQQFRWAWWLILFPSLALFAVMLLAVLVGEGLRDAFDPRQQSKLE